MRHPPGLSGFGRGVPGFSGTRPPRGAFRSVTLLLVALLAVACHGFAGEHKTLLIGTARVDITPGYPVRLSGYAARTGEFTGIAQSIYARALAFGSDREKPGLLIAVENCGVPANVREEVVSRLRKRSRIVPDRVTICSTHTHSAPLLSGYLSNLFYPPIPPDEQGRVDRYTRDLEDALEQVALAALADRQPALLFHGKGTAAFAANRRTKGGPVDHDVPVLVVKTPQGQTRAILAGYACHCTTVTGEFNQVCGDWAGYAAEGLEADFPGVTTLITIGCGGDANPAPRPGFELAKQHGASLASAVRQVLAGKLSPVNGPLKCRTKTVRLPYAPRPSRSEWESRAGQNNHVGQQAKMNLARLDRGEQLPTDLGYTIQTWSFGKSLAMVCLPGEVVVDYSLRLKDTFDPSRIWVTAYANDVPCYIPSERVLKEGGYEGGGAMVYYDRPAPFAPGIEAIILDAVTDLVPKEFRRR